MTQPRPTADELLGAVRDFLEADLLPTLDGRRRFHTRVAVNVLDTVRRELADGPAAAAAERARLLDLLTATGAVPGDPDDGGDATDSAHPSGGVEALSRALAERIRRGEVAVDDRRLLDHLRATARADVAIANPRHLASGDDGA